MYGVFENSNTHARSRRPEFSHQALAVRSVLSLAWVVILTLSVEQVYAATPTVVATVSVGADPLVYDANPIGVDVNTITNRIYVAETASEGVSVIDGTTDTVIATIATGAGAESVSVNETTNRIYVANFFVDTVSVIDGATDAVIATVNVGNGPGGIAANPVTNLVYVANNQAGTVSVIDGITNLVVATIAVGVQPLGVAVDADNNLIYVTNRHSDTVSVIDGSTNCVIRTIAVGDFPNNIRRNATTNTLYVPNLFADSVSVIDGATNTVTATIGVGDGPGGVGINSSNNMIYVTNSFDDSVSVIDGNTNALIGTVPVGDSPARVVVNPLTNRIYVTNPLDDTVSVLAENQPPSCVADLSNAQAQFLEPSPGSFVVTEGETISVPFTGDDLDLDTLTASLSGLPAGALLTPNSGPAPLTATVDWTPAAADKTGAPYTATVTFSDPSNATTSCEFDIEDINLRPDCSATTGAGSILSFECETPDGVEIQLDGMATDPDDDDATLMFHWDVSDLSVILDDPNTAAPTGTFPIGITMATLTVADGRGGVDVCDVSIEVVETMPPEVMCTTDIASLWPPNHKMREIAIRVVATDACQDPDFIFPLAITVRSDEPDNATGNGDGNTTGDVNGQDGFAAPADILSNMTWDPVAQEYVGTIELRAERAGGGDGRKYTIDVTALDSQGNAAITSCCVVVPHDRRGGGGP